MTILQVGLTDTTGALDAKLVAAAAHALNIQVMRDLPQAWDIKATVIFLPDSGHIPSGVWPVFLVDPSQMPQGAGGFHRGTANQPQSLVGATPDNDGWTMAASHETLEMLVDPGGNKLQSSRSITVEDGEIADGTSEFQYLVEACDPCEAEDFGYLIQGVPVSDFLTPHFYDPVAVAGTRYSFTGALKKPRDVEPGGYVSWVNPENDRVEQLRRIDPDAPPQIIDLGPADGITSLREWVDGQMGKQGLRTTAELSMAPQNKKLFDLGRERRVALSSIAQRRGFRPAT
ncbi:hypothetical protein LQ327_22425 [Actinomycetospora endophytica]|uniref:Acetoacetate decarboxylase n=1 Tax=Actinomycetospora endophytica TaxID=2291215 RepID=A0ABS8PE00_9PSEU|nr:hypothetical protein [Actinomycetospora endophytica]MCD2196132.1 hypothetical protein [Actinomycetospora endophytica]